MAHPPIRCYAHELKQPYQRITKHPRGVFVQVDRIKLFVTCCECNQTWEE